jgi:VanZ family protein
MASSLAVAVDPPIWSTVPPRRPHLFALAAIYALLVVYGSLAPLAFQPMPGNRIAQRLEKVSHEKLSFHVHSDLLVNVMLAIPLSFLLMAGLCVDRRRAAALLAAPCVVLACVAFAAVVEFLQLFFPPRVTSLNDIVSQGLGSCIGVLFWTIRGQATIALCRRLTTVSTSPGLARLLLPSYLLLLVFLQIAPFDLMTRPKELAAKWRAGRIHPIPFQTFCEDPVVGLENALVDSAYFLPVGLFCGLGSIRHEPRRHQLLHAAAVGLCAAGVVESLQLMIFSRTFDATDILTGTTATMVGAGAAAVFCRPHDRPPTGRSRAFLALAILLWLGYSLIATVARLANSPGVA